MASTATRVFVIVRAPNGDVREVPIGATAVVIGRDESADIRVEDKKVSRRHASFKLIDGEPWVEDLGSANGVKLNGKRVNKRAKITANDKVKVGGYQITLRDPSEISGSSDVIEDAGATAARAPRGASAQVGSAPPASASQVISRDEVTPNRTQALGATAMRSKKGPQLPDDGTSPVLAALDEPVKGQRFVLHTGENIIGRLEECDVPVLDGSVSRQHARVVYARDRISVSDLGSSNGTFVNDVRVEMAELANGDSLRVGNIRFTVELPPELSKAQGSAPVKAKARAKNAGQKEESRPYAAAGVVVLAVAIAVLGVAVWYKSRNKVSVVTARDSGAFAIAAADAVDAGAAANVVQDPDEPERTIEAVAPDSAPDSARDSGVKETLVRVEIGADGGHEAVIPSPVDDPDKDPPPVPPIAVASSTTPFGPRAAGGLPADLPEVDATFDFDAFVTAKLAAATALEAEGQLEKLRVEINELLSRDPINATGRQMLTRLVLNETSSDAMTKAAQFYSKGELARALKLYASIPDDAPQAKEARAKIEELKSKAIDQELDRGEKELKDKKTWKTAHRRFKDVLELDGKQPRALAGVRAVERKMRAKGVRFAAWVPPNADGSKVLIDTPEQVDQAIADYHGGEESLARIATLYASGQIEKALKRADTAEKKAEGPKKTALKKIFTALKKVKAEAERAKNETANDPSVAWNRLTSLAEAEAVLLPSSVKSVVKKDLEESIGEAFATTGSTLYDRGNYEGAFERWTSGLQLDPGNSVILAGIKKLEERARQDLENAELSAQRGERDACTRLKNITKISTKESEVFQRAMARARQVCG